MRPSVRRPTSHASLLERAAGDLDVLGLDGVPHLIDRHAVRVQLLDVDDDVDLAAEIAAHRHFADAVHRLELTA